MEENRTQPETEQQNAPASAQHRWLGRGIYGSKDVPIRALNIFIASVIGLIIILCVIGSMGGGFRITFDTRMSDVTVETQRVRYGRLVAEPQAPVRPGYKLLCWSTDSQETTPWNFEYTTVSNDTKLYAVWAPAEYTVTFDLASGSVNGSKSAASITVVYSEAYGTLPAPQKEGYTFAGWRCGDESITAQSTVTTVGDHVLTAVWQ